MKLDSKTVASVRRTLEELAATINAANTERVRHLPAAAKYFIDTANVQRRHANKKQGDVAEQERLYQSHVAMGYAASPKRPTEFSAERDVVGRRHAEANEVDRFAHQLFDIHETASQLGLLKTWTTKTLERLDRIENREPREEDTRQTLAKRREQVRKLRENQKQTTRIPIATSAQI